jgi:DNA-binding transcriptional ArsR family regulator
VDLQKPRLRAVAETLLALAAKPGGFTLAELAERVRQVLPDNHSSYAARHASYDLSKLRGKALVERVERTRRYRVRPYGIRILAGMLVLRERVIKPVLSGLGKRRIGRPPQRIHPIDQHYQALQHELRLTFKTLGLAA